MLPCLRFIPLVIFLITLPLAAQPSGSIADRVIDSSGGALPGVTVEAKSIALQGMRNVTTDPEGSYRMPLLPPGDYTLTFTLQGFASKQKKVTVSLGKESPIDASLTPAVSSEIVGTADAPVP